MMMVRARPIILCLSIGDPFAVVPGASHSFKLNNANNYLKPSRNCALVNCRSMNGYGEMFSRGMSGGKGGSSVAEVLLVAIPALSEVAQRETIASEADQLVAVYTP